MPSLRHYFHVDWDEVEGMPLAELDEHVWWIEASSAGMRAVEAQVAQVHASVVKR